jgi:hypothetical protein
MIAPYGVCVCMCYRFFFAHPVLTVSAFRTFISSDIYTILCEGGGKGFMQTWHISNIAKVHTYRIEY